MSAQPVAGTEWCPECGIDQALPGDAARLFYELRKVKTERDRLRKLLDER